MLTQSSVAKLREDKFFPKEQLTLEPYERDHAMVSCVYLQREFEG
jgi:rRNA 2'-O-methyltransferase fibrillarin